MRSYLDLLSDVLSNGEERPDRTGVGTLNVFGRSIRHKYEDGFPALTTKKLFFKGVIGELLWFLQGTEDPSFLIDNKIKIWDAWIEEDENGNKVLPHTYGVKWRNFDGVDQIKGVINNIKDNPYSRRHVVSAWDPRHVNDAALPWCHIMFQFDVMMDNEKKGEIIQDGKNGDISISVYQRSADVFLGVPFNLASYSALCYMVGEICNLRPKEMYYTFGNCHIYKNHIEQCGLQLKRTPYKLPQLILPHKDDVNDYNISDFRLANYMSHATIKGDVAV